MSLMLRLSIAIILAASSLFALSNADIENFLRSGYEKNPNVEIGSVSIKKRVRVEAGWEKLEVSIALKDDKKTKVQPQIFYVKGNLFAQDIYPRSKDIHTTVSDKSIFAFAEEMVVKNKNIELKKSSVVNRFKMEQAKGIEAVQIEFDLIVKQNNQTKEIGTTEVWFVDKGVIVPEILDITTGESLKYFVKGKVRDEHYDSSRLIAGNKNATYKIVAFSDPLCPACHYYMPDLIKLAEKHPKKIALYYYYRQVIPVSLVMEKASVLAKMDGKKGVVKKLYSAPFKIQSQDEFAVLDEANKRLGTSYEIKDVNQQKVLDYINKDAKAASQLLILGTPTIFINGTYDSGFKEFAKIKKELEK